MATTRRLSVVLVPPPNLVATLQAELESAELPAYEPINPTEAYLNVHFVGPVDERRLESVEESVERALTGFPTFTLQTQSLATLPVPQPGRPNPARQVAAFTDAPSPLLEIKDRLVRRLAAGRKHDKDGFQPRFTLGRFRTPVPDLSWRADVQCEAFGVGSLFLVESRLTTEGGRFFVLRDWELSRG